MVVLELLNNQTPLKKFFNNQQELFIYEQITKLVTNGHKTQFEALIKKEEQQLKQDNTYFLIQQLQSIVLVNALKKIGLVYSKISEQDLIKKLGIEQNLDLI